MKATIRAVAVTATATLCVGVGLLMQAPTTAAAPAADKGSDWVQTSKAKTKDGVSTVKEFVNAKTKVASTDDDATVADDDQGRPGSGVVVISGKAEDKTKTPKLHDRDVVKEQLMAVSGMSDKDARLWLSSLYPEDQPGGETPGKAPAADGGDNVAANSAINPALLANPAALPASPTAGLPIYASNCLSNDIDWYWHQYSCYFTTLDQAKGADWYLTEYQKSSGTVNGWYRKPYKVQMYMYHGQYNTIVDYSPAGYRQDTGPGCSNQTIALTVFGIASHSSTFQMCQGHVQPVNGGPWLWYGGWTGGAEWVGNSWSLPDRTYYVEDVQLVHSPPYASYGNRQFHTYGEWSGGSNWK